MTTETTEKEELTALVLPQVSDAEIEAQARLAKQYPRNLKKVQDEALGALELAPEFAARAYYCIPYKDGDKTTNVEGPSIKAATLLASAWGNCANGFRIASQDEERVILQGVFIDYQTNVRTLREVAVSRKRYDKFTKSMVTLREDRMTMALLAGGSKAVRNAILAGLPAWLVDAYFQKAKAVAAGLKGGKTKLSAKDLKAALDSMLQAFGKLGVTPEKLAAYMKDKLSADLSNEEKVAQMRGLYTAIKDGQANVEEVFGAGPSEAPASAQGAVKMDDLLAKKAAAPEAE